MIENKNIDFKNKQILNKFILDPRSIIITSKNNKKK